MTHERALIPLGDDYVDAIVGHRTWQIHLVEGVVTLASLYAPQLWKPQTVIESRCCCRGDDARMRKIPGACKGTCGLYAFRNKPRKVDPRNEGWFRSALLVHGQVYLWGKVKIHKRGYRAQFAKPAAFYQTWHPGDHIQRIRVQMAALQFGVPLVEMP